MATRAMDRADPGGADTVYAVLMADAARAALHAHLPHVGLFWTGPVTVALGLVLASAFPAIVVFAQEPGPANMGTISGLFFGVLFGMGGIGAAAFGRLAGRVGIAAVYELCAFLPDVGRERGA